MLADEYTKMDESIRTLDEKSLILSLKCLNFSETKSYNDSVDLYFVNLVFFKDVFTFVDDNCRKF